MVWKECPLRARQITTCGRFRPYGPFYDLIGNAEEWRADRCEPMERTGPDPLCMSGSEETSPGQTDPGQFFIDGGSFENTWPIQVAPDVFPYSSGSIPGQRVDWGPMPTTRNYVNFSILGFRCAYDVP